MIVEQQLYEFESERVIFQGDIDSPWSHDLYEDDYTGKQRIGSSEGTKIMVSNLEFGVTDSDLEVGTIFFFFIASEMRY